MKKNIKIIFISVCLVISCLSFGCLSVDSSAQNTKAVKPDVGAANTLMAVNGTQSATSNFLSTNTIRKNITNISFTDEFPCDTVTDVGKCFDVSEENNGLVLAFTEDDATNPGFTKITIGANGTIVRANVNSSYLFSYIGANNSNNPNLNSVSLNFNNSFDATLTNNMNSMFERFASGNYGSSLVSVTIDSFPFGFGAHASMNKMFLGYASQNPNTPLANITLPAFPSFFGMWTRDMTSMFSYFASNNYNTSLTRITLPTFPNFFGLALNINMSNMFSHFVEYSDSINAISIYWPNTDLYQFGYSGNIINKMFDAFSNGVPVKKSNFNLYVMDERVAKMLSNGTSLSAYRPNIVPLKHSIKITKLKIKASKKKIDITILFSNNLKNVKVGIYFEHREIRPQRYKVKNNHIVIKGMKNVKKFYKVLKKAVKRKNVKYKKNKKYLITFYASIWPDYPHKSAKIKALY